MDFAFSWELPAAVIGAVSILCAGGACVWAVARSAHGPSHREIVVLALVALVGIWSWSTRTVMAKRLFPDSSGAVEEAAAFDVHSYADCAGFVGLTKRGHDDGHLCAIDVPSIEGRYVGPTPPPASQEPPCQLLAVPELRKWTFAPGSDRDWCK